MKEKGYVQLLIFNCKLVGEFLKFPYWDQSIEFKSLTKRLNNLTQILERRKGEKIEF